MSTQVQSDLELVLQAVVDGRRVDPELAKRIEERSEHVREQVFRKHGLVTVSDLTARELSSL